MDLDQLHAIDIHVHVEQDSHGCFSLDQELLDASAKYFRADQNRTPTVSDVAEHYRARNMAAVVFTVDAPTGTGHPPLSSEEIADAAAEHADVLIPFGSVDPHAGKAAVARARRLVDRTRCPRVQVPPQPAGLRSRTTCVLPAVRGAAGARVPALFHTGQTGIGAGLPGGRGIRLRYSAPMLLDDVAADFPELTIVMAHPSVPWQDEAISIATHKANVYIDLSGWSPKYFPPQLVRAANRLLRPRSCSAPTSRSSRPTAGSPTSTKLEIKDDVRPLILKDNAIRLLGLS